MHKLKNRWWKERGAKNCKALRNAPKGANALKVEHCTLILLKTLLTLHALENMIRIFDKNPSRSTTWLVLFWSWYLEWVSR